MTEPCADQKSIPRVGLIGYGSWATALAGCIASNGHPLNWWVGRAEVAESLQKTGRNPRYLSDYELPKDQLNLRTSVQETVAESELLFLCMPSAFLAPLLESLPKGALKDKECVSFVKGLDPETGHTIGEYLTEKLGLPETQFAVVSGPSHAEEVIQEAVTYLTSASNSTQLNEKISYFLESPTLHMLFSTHVRAVEFSGVLKNIYTVGAGLALGLGYRDNFLAVYIGGCLHEMRHFLEEEKGCPADHITDSVFMGDLLTSAYSPFSRNRHFGFLVGQGKSISEARTSLPMVAEGYYATRLMIEKQGYQQPIARMIYDVLYKRLHPEDAFRDIELILR